MLVEVLQIPKLWDVSSVPYVRESKVSVWSYDAWHILVDTWSNVLADLFLRFAWSPVPSWILYSIIMLADWLNGTHILNAEALQMYADAVFSRGLPLQNCFGFVDGTVRPFARPGEHQRQVLNGHKRVHSLKFQSLALPNGLIVCLLLFISLISLTLWQLLSWCGPAIPTHTLTKDSYNTWNFMPYSSRIMCGLFNVPIWTYGHGRKVFVRRGLRFIVLIREDTKV